MGSPFGWAVLTTGPLDGGKRRGFDAFGNPKAETTKKRITGKSI
jgi:hypothetical protein